MTPHLISYTEQGPPSVLGSRRPLNHQHLRVSQMVQAMRLLRTADGVQMLISGELQRDYGDSKEAVWVFRIEQAVASSEDVASPWLCARSPVLCVNTGAVRTRFTCACLSCYLSCSAQIRPSLSGTVRDFPGILSSPSTRAPCFEVRIRNCHPLTLTLNFSGY